MIKYKFGFGFTNGIWRLAYSHVLNLNIICIIEKKEEKT